MPKHLHLKLFTKGGTPTSPTVPSPTSPDKYAQEVLDDIKESERHEQDIENKALQMSQLAKHMKDLLQQGYKLKLELAEEEFKQAQVKDDKSKNKIETKIKKLEKRLDDLGSETHQHIRIYNRAVENLQKNLIKYDPTDF